MGRRLKAVEAHRRSVFPRKWEGIIDRTGWGNGGWDGEPDREQWADPETGYPCLLVRLDTGALAGYVGVYPVHPAYGEDLAGLPGYQGITWFGSDEAHWLEPLPIRDDAHVDLDDPKSVVEIVKLPEHPWFFGFDCDHGGDLAPQVAATWARTPGLKWAAANMVNESSYKTVAFVKNVCAEIAMALAMIEHKLMSLDEVR
jgi:hypothetical protein